MRRMVAKDQRSVPLPHPPPSASDAAVLVVVAETQWIKIKDDLKDQRSSLKDQKIKEHPLKIKVHLRRTKDQRPPPLTHWLP